jgi:hypothetical protein
MSVWGQQRHLGGRPVISALPRKADHLRARPDFALGPIPDSCSAASSVLFDYFIGAREKGRRNRDAKRFGGLEVNRQLEFRRLHTGRSVGLSPLRMRPA